MSAVDFSMHINGEENPAGGRVAVTMNGRLLPYQRWWRAETQHGRIQRTFGLGRLHRPDATRSPAAPTECARRSAEQRAAPLSL